MTAKVSDPSVALGRIPDGSVVAISGFNLAATPEHLILKLYERYEATGHPSGLFVISDALPAAPGRALDAVCRKLYAKKDRGFIKGILIPFLGFAPSVQKMVEENQVEAYSWPIGITAYWFREVASGRPGLVTKIGLDTSLDPREDGGALNDRGREWMNCRVDRIAIQDEPYLFYHAPKPDFALIRATTADETGNLSMEDEGIRGTVFNIAQATKARPEPGIVIGQVRSLTRAGSMSPREVDVPSPLVDYVVISPREHHWQSPGFEYDPRVSYRVMPPLSPAELLGGAKSPERDLQRVVARRVILELVRVVEEKGSPVLVNLGIGAPAMVSEIAVEEGIADYIITVLESGPWGGLALPGENFGLAISPFALSSIPDMFSNFEGGVIDAASLGFLQVDSDGNVNPSMLPGRLYGPGGFPVIAGGGPRTYFAGAFTAGKGDIRVESGGIRIRTDPPIVKFVNRVYKSFFSGNEARKNGKDILYVTERAVLRLTQRGVLLEEVAPGVDLESDILKRMEFTPAVSSRLEVMEKSLFGQEPMGIGDSVRGFIRR